MQQRKLTFFTSDWHLGHANSLIFDNRPFSNLEEMHRVLINNFNSTVPPGSVTYFLGDMGYTNGTIISDVVKQLNGTKILVLGNHDANPSSMYNKGFDAVMYAVTLYIAKRRVTMSHCPLRGVLREDVTGMRGSKPGENWHGETKNGMFTVADEGQFHLHGHIHSPKSGKSERILDRQLDVGVCANKFRPISISAIESWIAKYEKKEM